MNIVDDPLPAAVREAFSALNHAGDLSPGAGRPLCGEAGSVAEGTQVRFQLRVVEGRISEARFRAYGCPYTLATCNWLAGRLPGLTLAQLATESPQQWSGVLGVPVDRLTRLLTIEDALRAAAAQAQSEQGLGR